MINVDFSEAIHFILCATPVCSVSCAGLSPVIAVALGSHSQFLPDILMVEMLYFKELLEGGIFTH